MRDRHGDNYLHIQLSRSEPLQEDGNPVTDEPEVLTHIDNGVGRLTLNRPKAINSLTQTMVDIMAAVLAA